MNKLDLNSLKRKEDFIIIDDKKSEIIFTNAELGRSFNRSTEDGVKELDSLKDQFGVTDVIYLKQIHSDKILKYVKDGKAIKDEEGDAIITNEKDVIVGVFTADCVPIILVDEKVGAVGAIHSGWRGTFESITAKTIKRMKEEFNIDEENIKAYIGPHIRKCCYEVSEELRLSFCEKKRNIDKEVLLYGKNLNLEACIVDDLISAGVQEHNINSINLCTYCSEEIKLHSYRKSQGAYGRMFSFVVLH